MNASEIERAIDNGLTSGTPASDYWDGLHGEGKREVIALADRDGIEAAIAALEDLAACPPVFADDDLED